MEGRYPPGIFITLLDCTDVTKENEFNQWYSGILLPAIENLEFVNRMKFAGGHVFTYSARPGTTAAKMTDQVPHATRKMRNAALRSLINKSSEDYRMKFLGDHVSVLWESATHLDDDLWKVSGLTDNYIRVYAQTPNQVWNQIMPPFKLHINLRP